MILIGDFINDKRWRETARVATPGPGFQDPGEVFPHLLEAVELSKEERARQLVAQLSGQVAVLESLGALIAAAHVDAAIETLCKEFNIERNVSVPD